jgi:predicted Holliday junction resolvase-like endonuclease
MDITLFIIIVIVIIFIYYLINTIKDLQIEIKTMSNNCYISPNNSDNNTNKDKKIIETVDVKMKNDFVMFLDYLKTYFI